MDKLKTLNIILLHGWDQNREVWHNIEEMFSQDYNVQSWDLPGFGKEPIPKKVYGVPEYADWLIKKIEKENLKNVILIGHSFGGRITSYAAHKNPIWLKGIVLSASPVIYRPSFMVKIKIILYKLLKNLLPKKLLLNKEDLNARDKGLGKIRYKVIPFDQTDILKDIKVPVLIIAGQNDKQVPLKISKEIHDKIPNSKLEIIEGVSHFIFEEKPYLFYGKINKFIKNLENSSTNI